MKWQVETSDGLKIQCMTSLVKAHCFICDSSISEEDEVLFLFSKKMKPLLAGHSGCFESVQNIFGLASIKLESERKKSWKVNGNSEVGT